MPPSRWPCLSAWVCLLLAWSCAADGERGGTPGYLLVEEPGEELVKLPCHVTGDRYQGMLVAYLDDAQAPKWRRPYGGISGSPVYDEHGRVLGGTPRSFITNGSPGLLVRPSSEWADLLSIGRALGTPVVRTPGRGALDEEIAPGRKLGAYLVWGDAYSGTPGAVSLRQADEVILLSHEYRTFGAMGPCVLALIRTPVTSFAPLGEEVEMMYAPGPVVGTATYDDSRGVYGVLGLEPPHVRLAVVVEAPVLRRAFERSYCVAKHPRWCSAGVGWGVEMALASYALDHTLSQAGVRVERDGELLEDRTVRAQEDESLADAIVRFAEEATGDGLLACAEVRVAIRLNYPDPGVGGGDAVVMRGDGNAQRLLFTDPRAGLVAEPLRAGPRVIGATGEPVVSAQWTGRSPLLRRVGLFSGLEGAPVLDERGELRGMLGADPYGLARFGDGTSPWVPVVGASAMELDIERGRLLGSALQAGSRLEGTYDDIQPGSAIALVRSFGHYAEADYGTIAWRDGDQIYCAASAGPGDTRPTGPSMLALARVRVIDFVASGQHGEWTRVDEIVDIVGTAVYEGSHGSYALLGVAPPLIAVTIDIELDGERLDEKRFTVVGDPRLWREWLARILSAVLGNHFGRGGDRARLIMQVDEGEPVPVEVVVSHERIAAQEALAQLGSEVPSEVRITLVLR